MTKELPDPSYLRKILRYEPETGKLFWRKRTPDMFSHGNKGAESHCKSWNARFANKEALSHKNQRGYLSGRIDYKLFFAHRIAWTIFYGKPPKYNIDHINGDPSDNRIANMRDVTQQENCKNVALQKTNNLGVAGVYWVEQKSKWHVRIKVGEKFTSVGYFNSFEDAVLARKDAEKKNGYHENHGRLKND